MKCLLCLLALFCVGRVSLWDGTHFRMAAEGEHLFPNRLVAVLVVVWLAGPGEVESILFELLGERRKGGSRREMGQTENSTEFIRKINLRILKIKQTTGVFSKTLSLSWVCYPSTHPSRHFYCHDTHLPVDTVALVMPSVPCFGNFNTFKAVPKIPDLMYFEISFFFFKAISYAIKKKRN